ncbi:hypothetical protein X975_10157, partial [Stegodyphus mimosarum]
MTSSKFRFYSVARTLFFQSFLFSENDTIFYVCGNEVLNHVFGMTSLLLF